jgi:hypothetical protein
MSMEVSSKFKANIKISIATHTVTLDTTDEVLYHSLKQLTKYRLIPQSN